MPCNPLNIQTGLFITIGSWESLPSKSFDGKTLTLTTSGPSPGLLVQQGSESVFHAQLINRNLSYRVLGDKYLLILDVEDIVGSGTRRMTIVNFDTWTESLLFSVTAASSVPLPVIQPSQGNGSVFLGFGQNGTEHTSAAIRRSDNGDVLCAIGASIIPTGQTIGEATATDLIIHYSTGGTSKTKTCSLPVGECDISPSTQTFTDVAVGGCAVTPPTKQFTIENSGDDCLTVNSIADNGPFSVQSTSKTIPVTLGKSETVDVTVAFNPASVGNFNSVEMAVSTTPANGDNKLTCTGEGVSAEPQVSFNQVSFNFGNRPVGTSAPGQTLSITNSGSAPLTVSVPVLNASGFTCAGFNGSLNCGQTQTIALGFTPPSEGPHAATLSVTTNASGSPHSIQLNGAGCVANAEISVPASAPISMGQVEQGFRTVRIEPEIVNTGDAQLTFTAAIGGPDAALFGLPDPAGGSVTVAPSSRVFTIDPTTSCGPGPTGSGRTKMVVSFVANDTPRMVDAILTISGHNATNFPAAQTWTFPLSAEIVPPVALDVGLVVDRSGSMNDSLGTRVKMSAAIDSSQLLAELLRPDLDDRVSVVRFNHLPDVVVPMSPVSSTTAPTQNDILQSIQTGIQPADGNTAIAAGALVAADEVQKPRATTPALLKKAIVVLTDGKDNTGFEYPSGSGQWFSVRGGDKLEPLPATGSIGTAAATLPSDIDIYTVGLGNSSDIDSDELESLATQNNFFHVDQDLTGDKYFQLEKYYTQIFMDVANLATIVDPMYWIAPGQKHEIEFDVLRGDVRALIVLYDWKGLRLPFFCVSPRGEIVDPVMIPSGFLLRSGATSQARFVEIMFPSKEAERYAGRWKVVVTHDGRVCRGMPGRKQDEPGFLPNDCGGYKDPLLYGIAIGVGSNFRMMPFVTPGPVYVGDPILLTALVSEAGLPVIGCTVSVEWTAPSGATGTVTLMDDGVHADGDPDDGEYARTFTQTGSAGTYHFRFRATGWSRDGESVMREALRDKAVLPRKPTGEPDDGHKPDPDECCEKLLEELRAQNRLLKKLRKMLRKQVKIR